MNPEIILASGSPFRQEQLRNLGIAFSSHPPDLDERALESAFNNPIENLSDFLAEQKAQAIAQDHPEKVVIGSDQVLLFQNQTYPKPNSLEEVTQRLIALQGDSHELHTSLCVMWKGQSITEKVISTMFMHPLSQDEIEKYVSTDQPIGCAGGYKFEKRGSVLFYKVTTTDPTSIIGLPLLPLVSILRKWGISIL